jgi:hypothetical protein
MLQKKNGFDAGAEFPSSVDLAVNGHAFSLPLSEVSASA